MIKFRLNNTDCEAPEGSTVLDVAEKAGYKIPTLCFKKGLPHYSSCMACMVKDNRSGNFIPSCSALIQEGMDLDVSGEDIIALRSKALELLLSEHRAECEAPCRVVCPAGYNIPLMNRLIAAKDFTAAIELCISSVKTAEIHCVNCPAYCENACRRKKIDLPVSIRNLQLFIFKSVSIDNNRQYSEEQSFKKTEKSKRFASHIGKLEASELQEWLKECSAKVVRSRDISDTDSASGEAESCLHCDCRAAEDCRLRDLANVLSIKDPRGKLVNSPIQIKINHSTGLVFENAKCIKCGLCVRLCEELKEEPALCFMHRGFVSIISEPLTETFNSILKTRSQEVIDICPTGALSKFK